MIYLKNALGIHFGPAGAALEFLGRRPNGTRLLGRLHLPPATVADSTLFRSEVERFLRDTRTTPETVVMSLATAETAWRRFSLPPQVGDGLEQAIQLHMLNMVPGEIEDSCISHTAHKCPQSGRFEVDLFFTHRDRVRALVDLLTAAGLPPHQLTVPPMTLGRVLPPPRQLAGRTAVLMDLDSQEFSLHLYREGRFAAYRQSPPFPEGYTWHDLLTEIERLAADERLAEDCELDLMAILSDPERATVLPEGEPAPVQVLAERVTPIAPEAAADPATVDFRAHAAALTGLAFRPPAFNLLPVDWRRSSSRLGLISTAVLLAGVLLVGLFGLLRGHIQEAIAIGELEAAIAYHQSEYQSVMKLRQDALRLREEAATFRQVMRQPVSDLSMIREMTEQAGPQTYLQQYRRTANLDVGGFTDSVLDLQQRFREIPYFASVVQEGAITRKDGQERFHFIIQLREEK